MNSNAIARQEAVVSLVRPALLLTRCADGRGSRQLRGVPEGKKGLSSLGRLFAHLLILQFQPYHEFKVTFSSGLEVGWDKGQEMGVRGVAQILQKVS